MDAFMIAAYELDARNAWKVQNLRSFLDPIADHSFENHYLLPIEKIACDK